MGSGLRPEGRLSGIRDNTHDLAHLWATRVRQGAGLDSLSDGGRPGKELSEKAD